MDFILSFRPKLPKSSPLAASALIALTDLQEKYSIPTTYLQRSSGSSSSSSDSASYASSSSSMADSMSSASSFTDSSAQHIDQSMTNPMSSSTTTSSSSSGLPLLPDLLLPPDHKEERVSGTKRGFPGTLRGFSSSSPTTIPKAGADTTVDDTLTLLGEVMQQFEEEDDLNDPELSAAIAASLETQRRQD